MQILQKSPDLNFYEWLHSIELNGGAALIDKESGWTSFDVVAKLRNLFKVKKVGHAGTLDPLATGLLILCFGKATKSIEEFQGLHKEYSGIMKLGATTKTDDSEAEEENINDTSSITELLLNTAVSDLTGEIDQKPPKFSAKKVKGKKLYELARKNIDIEIKPSKVNVYSFEIVKFANPYVHFYIKCSKGTYIRSLARDLGDKLGTGGYLQSLRREAIGSYNVINALKVSEIIAMNTDYKTE